MSFKELVKLQIVSKKVSQSSLKYLIIFAIAEETFKHVGGFLKDRFRQKVTEVITQVNLVDDAVLLNKRHPMNQVRMRRVWSMKQSDESFIETNMVVDSIIHYIGKLDNIPSLQLIEHAQTLISYLQKHVQITKDIFVKVEKIEKDVESGTITSIILILSSNTLSASDISKWVRQIYMTHKENLRNSLGDSIFFFDHKHISSTLNGGGMDIRGAPEPQLQKSMMLMSAHKSISFTKTTEY